MNIEAWQLCILVTASIVLTEFAVNALLRRKDSIVLRKRVRTFALGLLAILTVGVTVVALGPTLADQLASVAAAVMTVVALWLTYRSYRATPNSDVGGTGAPDIPAPQPGPDSAVGASTGRDQEDTATSP